MGVPSEMSRFKMSADATSAHATRRWPIVRSGCARRAHHHSHRATMPSRNAPELATRLFNIDNATTVRHQAPSALARRARGHKAMYFSNDEIDKAGDQQGHAHEAGRRHIWPGSHALPRNQLEVPQLRKSQLPLQRLAARSYSCVSPAPLNPSLPARSGLCRAASAWPRRPRSNRQSP